MCVYLLVCVQVINWRESLRIPADLSLSQPAKDLICCLCCGPEERLGHNGAEEIKAHEFFYRLCFQTLRRLSPPYIPTIRFATDTSNFDPVDQEKPQDGDSDEQVKLESSGIGQHPEHAFFEFTFRRFFDDGGHPMTSNFDDH